MDDGRGDPGAVAAIALIDILHHLLAPLMFEIDVDVGRLVALFRHEAGKEQVVPLRIDRGDAQQEADHRIGRRAAPLAQYPLHPGKGDDVMDGQEIGGVIARADQAEFLVQQRPHGMGDMRAIAGMGGAERQFLQPLLRGPALRHGFVGIFVAKLVEREVHLVQQAQAFRHGFGTGPEQMRDGGGAMEMPFRIGLQYAACPGNGRARADATEHILQGAFGGVGIERVHRREQWRTRARR